jgi:hypothetical protein
VKGYRLPRKCARCIRPIPLSSRVQVSGSGVRREILPDT